MTLLNLGRLCLRVGVAKLAVLAIVVLAPGPRAMATDAMHFDGSGREDAWNKCTVCHGGDLLGNVIGPSCMTCHSDFSPPGPPAIGHHEEGREDPLNNCADCHGPSLFGDLGPSCFTCHDQLWPGPPVADPGGPYEGFVGGAVLLDGSKSFDATGSILSYDWDFGDGNTGTGASLPHTYASEGLYPVTLTVTDDDGLTHTATTTADITVSENLPPVADPGGCPLGRAPHCRPSTVPSRLIRTERFSCSLGISATATWVWGRVRLTHTTARDFTP